MMRIGGIFCERGEMRQSISGLLLGFLLVSACGVFDLNQTGKPLPNCAQVNQAVVNQFSKQKHLIIVLIEGNKEYQQDLADQSFDLEKVFLETLEPGDRLIGIWMEVSNLTIQEALFFNQEVEILPVPILSEEPGPTLLALPETTRTPSESGRHQSENDQQEHDQENRRIATEHFCNEVLPLRISQNKKTNEFNVNQDAEIDKVVNNFVSALQTENPNVMSVFEALGLASSIFSELCKLDMYETCSLLILSDMQDWREDNSEGEITQEIIDLSINLEGINIGTIWTTCPLFVGPCAARRAAWEEHFRKFKNEEVIFFSSNSNQTDIIKFLVEGK
jgi:hypothetical protein